MITHIWEGGGLVGFAYDPGIQSATIKVNLRAPESSLLTIQLSRVFKLIVTSEIPAVLSDDNGVTLLTIESLRPMQDFDDGEFSTGGPFLFLASNHDGHVVRDSDDPSNVDITRVFVSSTFFTLDVLAFDMELAHGALESPI